MNPLKRNVFLHILIFSLFIYPNTFLFAQNKTASYSISQLNKLSQNSLGKDDLLFQGTEHFLTNPLAKGSPYYHGNNWTQSDIFIGNRTFTNIELKFDVVINTVILKFKNNNDAVIALNINKPLIDSFRVNDRTFTLLNTDIKNINRGAYFEKIYKGKLEFYFKVEKSFVKNYSAVNPHGFYGEMKSILIIKDEQAYSHINSKKNLLDYFFNSRKEIKSFMRKNRIRFKEVNRNDFLRLAIFIDNLIQQ